MVPDKGNGFRAGSQGTRRFPPSYSGDLGGERYGSCCLLPASLTRWEHP